MPSTRGATFYLPLSFPSPPPLPRQNPAQLLKTLQTHNPNFEMQCCCLTSQVTNNSSIRLSGDLESLCMPVADPDMLTSTSDLQNEKEQMQRAWSADRRSACDALSHALVKGVMSSVLSEAQNAEDHAVKQV